MDIVDICKAILDERLKDSKPTSEDESHETAAQTQCETQDTTQSCSEGYSPDPNLNKILNQQSHLKRIIDQDNSIQLARNALIRLENEIESCRKTCTRENEEALNKRQELAEYQAKEVSLGLFTMMPMTLL